MKWWEEKIINDQHGIEHFDAQRYLRAIRLREDQRAFGLVPYRGADVNLFESCLHGLERLSRTISPPESIWADIGFALAAGDVYASVARGRNIHELCGLLSIPYVMTHFGTSDEDDDFPNGVGELRILQGRDIALHAQRTVELANGYIVTNMFLDKPSLVTPVQHRLQACVCIVGLRRLLNGRPLPPLIGKRGNVPLFLRHSGDISGMLDDVPGNRQLHTELSFLLSEVRSARLRLRRP